MGGFCLVVEFHKGRSATNGFTLSSLEKETIHINITKVWGSPLSPTNTINTNCSKTDKTENCFKTSKVLIYVENCNIIKKTSANTSLCIQTSVILSKQGSSENDGRSNVTDQFLFMIISKCCHTNFCLFWFQFGKLVETSRQKFIEAWGPTVRLALGRVWHQSRCRSRPASQLCTGGQEWTIWNKGLSILCE